MLRKLLVIVGLIAGCSVALHAQALQVTTTSLPGGMLNQSYGTQTLTATGGTAPYTWAVSPANALPPGLALNGTNGQITGTPTQTGSFAFTAIVTDSASATASRPLVIDISAIVISPPTLPRGSVNEPYAAVNLSAAGTAPFTWSIVAGAPPPGITLLSSGTLSGTPTVQGTFEFTIKVEDSFSPPRIGFKTYTITIDRALIITTSALPNGTINAAYTPIVFAASGGQGPYTWSNAGAQLPPGLVLSSAGVLSGTPTTAGNFTLNIRVSDSNSPPSQTTKTFQLQITNTLSITTTTLPSAAVGVAYGPLNLNATGGTAPYSWYVTTGQLPSGITLSPTGVLEGTPATPGTYNFTLTILDSSSPALQASRSYTMTVHPALALLGDAVLPTAVVGVFYSKQLESSATPNISWSLQSGSFPPGLSLNSNTGVLSGSANVAGTYEFTVRAATTNPTQQAEKLYRMIVNGALNITTLATLSDASLGVFYSTIINASGGVLPYVWKSVGASLPSGLSLSEGPTANTVTLSGTPTGLGTHQFTLQVTDSFSPVQDALRTFVLAVTNTLAMATETLPNGIKDLPYSQTLTVVGGTNPLTWLVTSGTLPVGISLTTAGVLHGTPTEVAAAPITITVTDARGKTSSRNFTFIVDPPLPALATPGLPTTLTPTQPSPLSLALASPHPSALTGKLLLTFTSKAEVSSDDPMTQFSNGTRSLTFTIPANTLRAELPAGINLVTGTVAGTVQLMANFDNGPQNQQAATLEILPTPPQMTNITAFRTAGGLEVQITGYASARRVSTVEFTFDLKIGNSVVHQTIQRNVDLEFSTWYRSPSSTTFGSSFSYLQSFTIDGDPNIVESVTVRLSNAQGGAVSSVIPFK